MKETVKETEQEVEFRAWGLSKIAVRNIVVFFILSLFVAIGSLARVIVSLSGELREANKQIMLAKEQTAEKIEALKNENIETVIKLNDAFILQAKIRDEIEATRNALKNKNK